MKILAISLLMVMMTSCLSQSRNIDSDELVSEIGLELDVRFNVLSVRDNKRGSLYWVLSLEKWTDMLPNFSAFGKNEFTQVGGDSRIVPPHELYRDIVLRELPFLRFSVERGAIGGREEDRYFYRYAILDTTLGVLLWVRRVDRAGR